MISDDSTQLKGVLFAWIYSVDQYKYFWEKQIIFSHIKIHT